MNKSLMLTLVALLGCNQPEAPAASAATEPAPSTPAPEAARAEPMQTPLPPSNGAKTVVDVAVGSPDHTTLVAALKAADLVASLASPGGVYTVFAPTNAAFAKLPPGTVEGLLKPERLTDLKNILQHHATVPIIQLKDLKDGQVLGMADGTKVTLHVDGDKVKVDDANIVASINAANGIVHVIDGVLTPQPK